MPVGVRRHHARRAEGAAQRLGERRERRGVALGVAGVAVALRHVAEPVVGLAVLAEACPFAAARHHRQAEPPPDRDPQQP